MYCGFAGSFLALCSVITNFFTRFVCYTTEKPSVGPSLAWAGMAIGHGLGHAVRIWLYIFQYGMFLSIAAHGIAASLLMFSAFYHLIQEWELYQDESTWLRENKSLTTPIMPIIDEEAVATSQEVTNYDRNALDLDRGARHVNRDMYFRSPPSMTLSKTEYPRKSDDTLKSTRKNGSGTYTTLKNYNGNGKRSSNQGVWPYTEESDTPSTNLGRPKLRATNTDSATAKPFLTVHMDPDCETRSMVYCSGCGVPAKHDASFCNSCGSKVR